MSETNGTLLRYLGLDEFFVFIDYRRDPSLNGRVWQKVEDINFSTTMIYTTRGLINVKGDAEVRRVAGDWIYLGMPEIALPEEEN